METRSSVSRAEEPAPPSPPRECLVPFPYAPGSLIANCEKKILVKTETGFPRKVLALLSLLQNAAMENGFGVVRFNLQGNVSAKLELNLSHCFHSVAYIQAISQF